jgi:hypothetical protein
MQQGDEQLNKPDVCQTRANTNIDAVPNEIPNDWNMATERVLWVIKNDH